MVTQSISRAARSSSSPTGQDSQDNASTCIIHATAVRFREKGVLLLGPPACGKSDLALRLMDAGGVLIADDQVCLSLAGDRLQAEPPSGLAGLIDLRGMGIMRVPFEKGFLDMAVDLKTTGSRLDPLPELLTMAWLGVELPKIELDASTASAVAKIKMALHAERIF